MEDAAGERSHPSKRRRPKAGRSRIRPRLFALQRKFRFSFSIDTSISPDIVTVVNHLVLQQRYDSRIDAVRLRQLRAPQLAETVQRLRFLGVKDKKLLSIIGERFLAAHELSRMHRSDVAPVLSETIPLCWTPDVVKQIALIDSLLRGLLAFETDTLTAPAFISRQLAAPRGGNTVRLRSALYHMARFQIGRLFSLREP